VRKIWAVPFNLLLARLSGRRLAPRQPRSRNRPFLQMIPPPHGFDRGVENPHEVM
jgi:hypothetical protein